MDGELAQVIALVAHGNEYLHAGQVDLSNHSAFRFVSQLVFIHPRNRWDRNGVEVAKSAQGWLAYLKSVKTTRLWNVGLAQKQADIPEHVAVAFAGGALRAIQADLPGGYEIWYPQWRVVGQGNQPWQVEYRGRFSRRPLALPVQAPDAVKKQLRQAVLQALTFARRPEVDASFWAGWFAEALDLLDSPTPVIPYYMDLLPSSGFALEARQILACATRAFVFGGMGSWNDMGFQNPQIHSEYGKVTRELYAAVKNAILMASNSYQME